MNSTDTPGGSGIPAGWYDDPSGEGLRWWDGERWTEHVHTAASAAAATDAAIGEASGEGKPPRDLVKLRESIRERGVKGVGMVLGAIVLLIVVVALLVAGGSDDKGGGEPGAGLPGVGNVNPAGAQAQGQVGKSASRAAQNQIKAAEAAARKALEEAQE